jgi:hypothetical protein
MQGIDILEDRLNPSLGAFVVALLADARDSSVDDAGSSVDNRRIIVIGLQPAPEPMSWSPLWEISTAFQTLVEASHLFRVPRVISCYLSDV